jgi:uncharacterized protein YaaR (DUF327 family)
MEIKGSGKGNIAKPIELAAKQAKNDGKTVAFAEKLYRTEAKLWRDKLDTLLEKIQSQGKILAKTRDLKELKKYKSLVKSFMKEAVKCSLKLKQNTSWNQWGKHRLLTIAEKVDKNIEELAQLMLEGEEKTLAILDKLDEIRGLLVDMYA